MHSNLIKAPWIVQISLVKSKDHDHPASFSTFLFGNSKPQCKIAGSRPMNKLRQVILHNAIHDVAVSVDLVYAITVLAESSLKLFLTELFLGTVKVKLDVEFFQEIGDGIGILKIDIAGSGCVGGSPKCDEYRDLSDRLNLTRAEGEKWIVNFIRETRMGADTKIDLEKNVIQISRPPLPIYQSMIEKTRGLAIRTQALGAAVARTG
ncbi:uncharacterized protein BT62DRAFT_994396 [Guyanagaster necrorhizus]|uniref:Uncharacterized protein n=1 Tax=Guyanagaster necrorhizus TaxID=856835 RepID=A0A9P7VSS8_9AGAR|nr:uncharacterized protein BT62DRAFT_994396 [Guyanagaster necrorhizus MCA 3950]KAG7446035.1 hypothetical protein BT62DRAFT_994396 [Guyanagaster necrorhizus MCA 3950]